MERILITGGAGFIGSHVVRRMVNQYPDYLIVNFDDLTYAGNLANLQDVENAPNYLFIKGDITNSNLVLETLRKHEISGIIHLAAESHVDRSITNPMAFMKTNVFGTATLMYAAQEAWKSRSGPNRFYHISTDEVYGSLGETGKFVETTPYDPRSPYSASKASSDHFVRASYHTYDFPVVISNCSNNYGPYQFPEKLIPLFINNIQENRAVPVYGKGDNIRDWLYVEDHAEAIDIIYHKGKTGSTYNIGGENEWKNIDLIHLLCKIMNIKLNIPEGTTEKLITYVKDRAGHDKRYAIDSSKLTNELGWKPKTSFEKGLDSTVDWYLKNADWLKNITSGAYQSYYEQQYINR